MATSRSKNSRKVKKKPPLLPSRIAERIGVPVRDWPGQCYCIACLMLEKEVVKGEPRYGHWRGPIAPGSRFDRGSPVTRHGWIQAKEGGRDIIIDPTRWVFEDRSPYIYQAPDFEGWYDAGGNVFREESSKPFPEFDSNYGAYQIPAPVRQAFRRLAKKHPTVADRQQLVWLANQSLNRLGSSARPVFLWLVFKKLGALIPIDNRRLVLGE